MKKIYFLFIFISTCFAPILGQERYKDVVFDSVIEDSVVYGRGNTFDGKLQELKIDIYQPANDNLSLRPVLIVAHGGAFLPNNTRRDKEIVDWCRAFAKKGYVCIGLQYRLGILFDFAKLGSEFSSAVWRATLDYREAVKYLKSNYENLKIDTNQFYGIGISAGAIAMIHAQMLDLPEELNNSNPKIDTLGKSLVFNRQLAGISPKIKGMVNLCGAIGDVRWMQNNRDYNLLSIHGDKDPTVPYKTDFFRVASIPIARLSGSFSIDSMARTLDMDTELYTFKGAVHVPFSPRSPDPVKSKAYMDTTENLIIEFLYKRVMFNSVAVNPSIAASEFQIFPNPAREELNIRFFKNSYYRITLFNTLSTAILNEESNNVKDKNIKLQGLTPGVYLLKIEHKQGSLFKRIIIE